ncbi:MAG: hypothetical protein WBA76_19150 [Phormidesmis sp.]
MTILFTPSTRAPRFSITSNDASTGFSRSLKDATFIPKLIAIFLMTGGLGLGLQEGAIAQTVIRDPNTGGVSIPRNAFELETGPLGNNSNIPLPSVLPEQVGSGQEVPTNNTDGLAGALAPNSVNLRTNIQYVEDNFPSAIDPNASPGTSYRLDQNSVTTTTTFAIDRRPRQHSFAEGIEVTVLDANGNPVEGSTQTRFVRGDKVTEGPGGTALSESEDITVTYNANQSVRLRVLNIRADGAPITESGVYFTRDGQLIAEDFQGGGDKDFNDGNYLGDPTGTGTAQAVKREEQESQSGDVETELAPEIRRDEAREETAFTTVDVAEDVVTEERDRGSIDVSEAYATRLGHAIGVRTPDDEQLIYNRYAGVSQLRAGSDGISATGQLSPLLNNPSAPPTLLTGDLTFNPFADDNEAGFIASVGVTQFLNRTHRVAMDALGNPIENPNSDGPRLLEPTGFLSNRRLIGYVPAIASSATRGEQLSSSNGIFDLPADQMIEIAPPNPQQVGRGDSAYTDNVGGLLIEKTDGSVVFEPQWAQGAYAQAPISIAAGEATRIVYALVPQQPNQALRVGQSYAVSQSANGYTIADGGFKVISADRQPQNFYRETADVFAVEDTLAAGNAVTALFNGVRGTYVEPSGDRAPTVDLTQPGEADARVGNLIYPAAVLLEQAGQPAYAKTTRAAGLYIGGALTGGIGNQRDTVTQVVATTETETDQIGTELTTRTFSTPVTRIVNTGVQIFNIFETTGNATFRINEEGELDNATFSPISDRVLVETRPGEGEGSGEVKDIIVRGEETLTDTNVTTENARIVDTRTTELARDETTDTDSYANVSPIGGELALGGVLNFGNTPWSPAANTLRAELFIRDTIFGSSSQGSDAGWRAALLFHPFGEKKREAYQYNADGQAVPIYQTTPVMDANGQQQVELVSNAAGDSVELPVNEFAVDESGDRIPTMVGTGRSKGPGLYVRVQDVWDDGDSTAIDGGLEISF